MAVLTHCNWTEFIESTVVGRVQTQKSLGRGFLWRHLCQLDESHSSNQQQSRLWMPKRESGVYIDRAPTVPAISFMQMRDFNCNRMFLLDCNRDLVAHPVILPAIAAEAGGSQVQNCLGKLVSSVFEKKNEQKRLGMWARVFMAHLFSSIQKALGWNPSMDVGGRLTKVSRSNWWLKFAN